MRIPRLNQNQITILLGFALFLLGIITNSLLTLRFNEFNEEMQSLIGVTFLMSLYSLVFSIVFGGKLYIESCQEDKEVISYSVEKIDKIQDKVITALGFSLMIFMIGFSLIIAKDFLRGLMWFGVGAFIMLYFNYKMNK